jgi:hypothetical protein
LAEDNPKDVELTIEAMTDNNLTNDIFVVNDSVRELEYLRCQRKNTLRKEDNPAVIKLNIKMPRMNGVGFWTFLNELQYEKEFLA